MPATTPVHDHDNLGGSNRLLTMAEAAALLNVPIRRLQKKRVSWGIPAHKVGREMRFYERHLYAWLAKRAA